jgi:hypothetical protein
MNMHSRPLPPNLRQVLDALEWVYTEHLIEANRTGPSVREIGRRVEAKHGRKPSTSTVWSNLEDLRQRGLVEKTDGKYRIVS